MDFRDLLALIRGLSDSEPPTDLTDLSITPQEAYDLQALAQYICMVFERHGDNDTIIGILFDHYRERHGANEAAEQLDILKRWVSKSQLKYEHRMSLARQFRRAEKTGMKKAQFLREVMKVRPEDEGEQRRYLDRALRELDKLDKVPCKKS